MSPYCLVPCWKDQGKVKLLAQSWGLSPVLTLQALCYTSWKEKKTSSSAGLRTGAEQQDGWFRLKTNLLLSVARKG